MLWTFFSKLVSLYLCSCADPWQNEEAPLENISEIKSAYIDFRPVFRPIIYRLSDHLKVYILCSHNAGQISNFYLNMTLPFISSLKVTLPRSLRCTLNSMMFILKGQSFTGYGIIQEKSNPKERLRLRLSPATTRRFPRVERLSHQDGCPTLRKSPLAKMRPKTLEKIVRLPKTTVEN